MKVATEDRFENQMAYNQGKLAFNGRGRPTCPYSIRRLINAYWQGYEDAEREMMKELQKEWVTA